MQKLTLQLYLHGNWHDAMQLAFDSPEAGLASPCSFGYLTEYLASQLDNLGCHTSQAVSATLPLAWDACRAPQIPAFLHDLLPAGAARRFLLERLAIPAGETMQADLLLLARCTPAPIGHLRIKEAVEAMAEAPAIGFSREEVVSRDTRFLEYAYEQGAAIGGATGAGGEAPKLLLAECTQGLLYPDASLADEEVRQHWFVKFPRNRGSETDRNILRSEYCYYQALNRLGIETVAQKGLALEEAGKPSLWMQRFDRQITCEGVNRLAVESIYSLAGITRPGSFMLHTDAIGTLTRIWIAAGQQDEIPLLLSEYLRRDLLNHVLGNNDNHGRNTAILRDDKGLRLAPIYDLAPMVMDDEGITRTTKWPKEIELAGNVDWLAACNALAGWTDPQQLYHELKQCAQQLRALPDLLREFGLPEQTMNHPRIPLKELDRRLRTWGLM
jgi:serine/threonine-protein kinase HipA